LVTLNEVTLNEMALNEATLNETALNEMALNEVLIWVPPVALTVRQRVVPTLVRYEVLNVAQADVLASVPDAAVPCAVPSAVAHS
jgi:hypothetical protein